jgi:hypothetical protein
MSLEFPYDDCPRMRVVVAAILNILISLVLDGFRELVFHILINFPGFFESTPLYPYIIRTYTPLALPVQLAVTLLPILTNLPMIFGLTFLIYELLWCIIERVQGW